MKKKSVIKKEDSPLVDDKKELATREANKSTDSQFDRIYKYFHSKSRVELTPEEQLVMTRWEKAWLLLCRHRTRNAVADLMQKLFNVSKGTAYDDIRNAMMMFSDPREDMKAAKKAIVEEALLRGADSAWKKGNLDMHMKYMKEYAEINGLKEGHDADGGLAELIKKFKAVRVMIDYKIDDVKEEAEKMRDTLEKEYTDFETVE